MKKLFLDIETLPAVENLTGTLKILYGKESKKKKRNQNDDFEQYFLKTSFDGAFGRILCIGYAVEDNPVEILYTKDNEKEMLERFWEIARDTDLFIGHNVMDFDLRFILQRSIVNKVKPTKELNFARYRNFPIYDTMKEWVNWSTNLVGLEHIALALGIPTPKDGIDGSQVYDFYKRGRIQEILDYCKRDVATAREIYKRITFSQN